MDYQEFYQILKKGETITSEFMLESNAFQDSVKDDAELAMNIIAMANNGNVSNYLVIGVSDDGQVIQSVSNENLTDDNLQAFCMETIFPPPIVKLSRMDLTDNAIETDHEGKTIVIIQIGPQPHKCFRFKRDFIADNGLYYFRNHEVWIRRNTTPDLATPEEIKRLLQGHAAVALPVSELTFESVSKHSYIQIPQERFLLLALDDLSRLAKKDGGKLYHEKDPFLRDDQSISHYVIIFINGNPVILRVIIVDSCVKKGEIIEYNRRYISFHNGLLLISRGTVPSDPTESCEIKLREPWGWFCAGDAADNPQTSERSFKIPAPANVWGKIGEPISWNIVFSNIYNFGALKNAWETMLKALINDENIRKIVEENCTKTLAKLVLWMNEGCPMETNKFFRPKSILENEIWDPDKYGNVILIKQAKYCEAVNALLKKMDDAYGESFSE